MVFIESKNNILTIILGLSVCACIIWKEYSLKSKYKGYFISAHFLCASFIILGSLLDKENSFRILILLVTTVYIGSIIIKQIYFQEQKKKDCGNDAFLGNFYNSYSMGFIGYICLYLLLLILVMISLLKRADDNFPMKGLDSLRMLGIEYVFIFFLPLILVLLNEFTATWPIFGVDGSKNKYISSQTVFEKIITGDYNYDKDKASLIMKLFLMVFFIFLILLGLFNYTGKASPYGGPIPFIRDNIGAGDGNGILFLVLIILSFFNILVRGLFIQECSVENIKKENDLAKNSGDFGCEIAKYGGVLGLFFISYIATVLYRIPIPRDKVIAIGFIIVSIFGFSELFIHME